MRADEGEKDLVGGEKLHHAVSAAAGMQVSKGRRRGSAESFSSFGGMQGRQDKDRVEPWTEDDEPEGAERRSLVAAFRKIGEETLRDISRGSIDENVFEQRDHNRSKADRAAQPY